MTVVFSAMSIANWLVNTWLPLYLYERFHMSLTEAGFTATFYIQGASVAGIVLGGWLGDRWSLGNPRGRIYTQAAGLLVASPFLFLLGHTGARSVLIAALVLFGAGRGFYDCNTMPVLCQVARDDLRSTGYGIFNFAGCLVGGIVAALRRSAQERDRAGRRISDRRRHSLLVGLAAAADSDAGGRVSAVTWQDELADLR